MRWSPQRCWPQTWEFQSLRSDFAAPHLLSPAIKYDVTQLFSRKFLFYGKDRELLSYCFIQGQNIHLWVHSSCICHQTASSLTRQMLVLSNVNLFRQCMYPTTIRWGQCTSVSDETIVREVAFLVRLHSTQTNVNVVLQINYISNKCKCSQTNISQTHLKQM